MSSLHPAQHRVADDAVPGALRPYLKWLASAIPGGERLSFAPYNIHGFAAEGSPGAFSQDAMRFMGMHASNVLSHFEGVFPEEASRSLASHVGAALEAAMEQWREDPRLAALASPDSPLKGPELFAEACGAGFATAFATWGAIMDPPQAARCGVPPKWPSGALRNPSVDSGALIELELAAGDRLAQAIFEASPKERPEFLAGACVGLPQLAVKAHAKRYPSGMRTTLSIRRDTPEFFLFRSAVEGLGRRGASLAAAAATGLASKEGLEDFIQGNPADRMRIRDVIMAWGESFAAFAEAQELGAAAKKPTRKADKAHASL